MKERETKQKKIAFFGHFDSSNFGNECTLQAILYNLRRFQPNTEAICICTGPEATRRTHQIEAFPITERFLKSWVPRNVLMRAVRRICIDIPSELCQWVIGLARLRQASTLIIPGTGLLTDAYGLRRWGPYNLFKWSLLAKLSRCKLFFVSVGAGPIYGALGKWFIKSALSFADFRSYRDESTKQYLLSIGFRADNDRVYPDLAFSLPEAIIGSHHTKESSTTLFGLGVMAYAGKYSVASPSQETYRNYLEILTNVTSWLLTHRFNVRLLIGDVGDVDAKQEFRRLLRSRSISEKQQIIDEHPNSVEDLLLQIATTDFVVATRFHNVLLALLCNKPVIAISFHHKCLSLMQAMGLASYCLDINGLEYDTLIEKISELKTNARKLKPLIERRASEYRKTLDQQYKIIFGEI